MASVHASFAHRPLFDWQHDFRTSADAEVRYRAIQAIAALGGEEESLNWLRQGLDDGDSAIRASAARQLLPRAGAGQRLEQEQIWASIRIRWEQLLSDDDPDVRFESARGLLRLDPACQAATITLLMLLDDDETQPPMLAAILRALTEVTPADVAVAPRWPRYLEHPQAEVREQAARALGTWGRQSVELATNLILLLDDEEPFVREEAARSFGHLGVSSSEILAALTMAADDEDELVATVAKASLSQLQGASR